MPVEPHCLRLWIVSCHQLIQMTSPCTCPSRTSTKLVAMVLSLWTKWKLVFSNLAWWSPLLQPIHNWSEVLDMYHKLSVKLFLWTVWASMLRTCLSKVLVVVTWLVQQKWHLNGSSWFYNSGDYSEPSRPNQCWLCTCAGLSQSSHTVCKFGDLKEKKNDHFSGKKTEECCKFLKSGDSVSLLWFLESPCELRFSDWLFCSLGHETDSGCGCHQSNRQEHYQG